MPKNDEVPGSSFADSSSFQTATAAQQCPKVSARRSPPPPVCTLPRIYAVGPSSLKNSPSPTAKDKHPPPALFNNKRESLRSCLKSHQPEFATNRGASRSCSGGGLVPAASRRSSVSDARSSDLLDHDAEVTASVVTPIECKASYRSRSSTHPHRNPLHTAFEASEAPQGAQLAEARTANSVSSHDCRAISDSALIHIPPRTTATDDDDSQENRISGSIRHNKSFSGPSRGSMMSGNGGALVRRARRSSQTSGILLPTNNLDGRPSTASSVAVSIETRKSCNSKALPADSGNLRYDILSISPDDDVCQPANLRASRSKSFSGAPYQRMINNRSERASYPVTIVATHDMESLSSAPTSVRDTIRSCNSRRATLEGNGLVNRQALSTPGDEFSCSFP